MSFGFGDELLDRRAHDLRGEVRTGVAVEELRDVLRRADELGRLLLQGVVAAWCRRLVLAPTLLGSALR